MTTLLRIANIFSSEHINRILKRKEAKGKINIHDPFLKVMLFDEKLTSIVKDIFNDKDMKDIKKSYNAFIRENKQSLKKDLYEDGKINFFAYSEFQQILLHSLEKSQIQQSIVQLLSDTEHRTNYTNNSEIQKKIGNMLKKTISSAFTDSPLMTAIT